MKDIESQTKQLKNKFETVTVNKSFEAVMRQAKWSLERKIERMETCSKTKYVGLLTIPTGKGVEAPEGFREKY